MHISRGRRPCVDDLWCGCRPDVGLRAKEPLVVFPSLVHIGVARSVLVLGRRRRVDDGGIDNGTLAHLDATVVKVLDVPDSSPREQWRQARQGTSRRSLCRRHIDDLAASDDGLVGARVGNGRTSPLSRGRRAIRVVGWIWMGAMLCVTLSSFAIRELNDGEFSWIHGLTLWTLFSMFVAVFSIHRGLGEGSCRIHDRHDDRDDRRWCVCAVAGAVHRQSVRLLKSAPPGAGIFLV